MTIEAGTTILGKYRILRELGAGAMGRVWLAEESGFDRRQVAIKEVRVDLLKAGLREQVEERFQREIDISARLARVKAPYVVTAITSETLDNATRLLVMEYAPGQSLAELIAANPQGLPPAQAVRLTRQLCQALAALHNLPEAPVHRDVKPSNILLSAAGDAQLSDFGLVQMAGTSSGRSNLTAAQHPGTPLYMAPEQAGSAGYLSPAADIYALGCVLFEMLTGKRYKNRAPGTRPSSLNPAVPPWLDDAVRKALAQEPYDRFENGEDFAAALAAPAKAAAQPRWLLGAVFSAVAIVLVVGAWLVLSRSGSDAPPAQAALLPAKAEDDRLPVLPGAGSSGAPPAPTPLPPTATPPPPTATPLPGGLPVAPGPDQGPGEATVTITDAVTDTLFSAKVAGALAGETPAQSSPAAVVAAEAATLTPPAAAAAAARATETPTDAPTATLTATLIPSATPSPSPTETLTETPSPPPTETPTATATPLPTPTATSTPDLGATATAAMNLLATSVAATLTALPTATDTPTPTPTFTLTPDLPATETAIANRLVTSVAATLTAMPSATATPSPAATATPMPDLAATALVRAEAVQTAVAATLTAQPTATPTRRPTDTPSPTFTLTKTPRTSYSLRTQPAGGSSAQSIWERTEFVDLTTPGDNLYSVDVSAHEQLRWAFEWCALSDAGLQDILEPLALDFRIDSIPVPLNDITTGSKNAGQWRCRYWSTLVSGWPPGEVVTLEIHYRLARQIDDGRDYFPAGEYSHRILAHVR